MSNTRLDYKSELRIDEEESSYYVAFKDNAPIGHTLVLLVDHDILATRKVNDVWGGGQYCSET